MTALLVTAALLGLCAEAVAAPISLWTRIADLGVSSPKNTAVDPDFLWPSIEETVFDGNPDELQSDLIATHLSDDLPDSHVFVRSLSHDTNRRAPEPPAIGMLLAGLALIGIFGAFPRVRRILRRSRRQKKHRLGRRVRIALRMMA